VAARLCRHLVAPCPLAGPGAVVLHANSPGCPLRGLACEVTPVASVRSARSQVQMKQCSNAVCCRGPVTLTPPSLMRPIPLPIVSRSSCLHHSRPPSSLHTSYSWLRVSPPLSPLHPSSPHNSLYFSPALALAHTSCHALCLSLRSARVSDLCVPRYSPIFQSS
jgi:hypothetical protein